MKYIQFKKEINAPIFTLQELKLKGIKIFAYQLTLWVKQNYIEKLKNGIYLFTETINDFTPEELSNILYAPSYISLEKALSFYGLIPEMVYSITAVTPKTTRKFNNPFGNYEFHHIKPELFFGYTSQKGHNLPYLLANPEKALLDLIYFNKIKNQNDLDSYRINWEELKKIILKNKLKKYAEKYKNKRIRLLVKLILERLFYNQNFKTL